MVKVVPINVELLDHMGDDLSVVNAARVSFEKTSEYTEDGLSTADQRLIRYLAKHKHKSPFNHAFASFRVKAPIFVARQLVKHKFLPWNELSRRYVDTEPEFYIPEGFRKKVDNVKQGSSDTTIDHNGTYLTSTAWHVEDSLGMYNHLLSAGVCPEQARMVLPQNTMTEWIWSGSLGAFADMAVLRLDSHTQAETRQVALLISEYLQYLFPISWKELLDVR